MNQPISCGMSLRERVCGCVLVGVFFILFYSATEINFYTLQLDSAFMVEMIDTTFKSGVPLTYLTKSALESLKTTIIVPADRVCRTSLEESAEPMNEFDRHSFPVLYLTVPFRLLFGAKSIAFFLNTLSFVGLLVLVYVIMRERGVPAWASASMVFLVSAHPDWSQAAFGQLGPDRYFPPLGLLYMWLLYERLAEGKMRSAAIVVVGLLSILVTERSSTMIGLATFGGLLLYRGLRGWQRSDLLLGGIAAVAIGYPLAYGMLYQDNPDYGSFQVSMGGFLQSVLHTPGYAEKLEAFLLIDIPLFGILSVFEWRLAAIALGAMLPNVLGSMGGAEKIGWSMHYHAMYHPFLVVAVVIGFANLWKMTSNSRWRHVVIAIPMVLGACFVFLDPYSLERHAEFSVRRLREYAIVKTLEFQTKSGAAPPLIFFSNLRREVASSVPARSEVTASDSFITALYGKRLIHFYPLGLESSDYAVLAYKKDARGVKRFVGANSYLGPETVIALDDCMNNRLQSAGYSTVADFPYGDGLQGAAVLKRVRPRPGAQN